MTAAVEYLPGVPYTGTEPLSPDAPLCPEGNETAPNGYPEPQWFTDKNILSAIDRGARYGGQQNPEDIADTRQTTLLKLFMKQDGSGETFMGDPAAFAFTAARNAALSHFRCRSTQRERAFSDITRYSELHPGQLVNPGPEHTQISDLRWLTTILNGTDDEKHKEFIKMAVMFHAFDLSYKDIAVLTNSKVGTVKSSIHRGLELLRKYPGIRELTGVEN